MLSLPIPAEVHARPRLERQGHHATNLPPVIIPAVILPPSAFLRIASEVSTGDVVVVPLLSPTHPGEETLSSIRAGFGRAVGELVVDRLDHVAAVQGVPRAGLVRHDLGAARDVVADEGGCRPL